MKRQIILSLVVVFALAVFAPAVVKAMDNSSKIVNVDEKKTDEKKAEAAKTTETKPVAKTGTCCSAAKTECTAKKTDCSATKTECTEKKAECTEKKAETK